MKFTTGFLLGVAAGTLYGLLTAKKTGPDRQQAIAGYVDDVTGATDAVAAAVTRLGKAATALQATIHTTLEPNVAAIEDAVTDFGFQTEAHTQALGEHLATITDTLEKAVPDSDAAGQI
ncbi:YtxH domain-containing protein [Lacticaseibacillus suihuaensis]